MGPQCVYQLYLWRCWGRNSGRSRVKKISGYRLWARMTHWWTQAWTMCFTSWISPPQPLHLQSSMLRWFLGHIIITYCIKTRACQLWESPKQLLSLHSSATLILPRHSGNPIASPIPAALFLSHPSSLAAYFCASEAVRSYRPIIPPFNFSKLCS